MVLELVFLGLTDFFTDINLVIKIFVLMTIISFVNNHIENKALKIVVFLVLSFFIIFDYWALFGGIYILYMLLMLGISGILVDIFFVSGMMGGHEPPDVSGKDVKERGSHGAHHAAHGAVQAAARMFRR
ncbi:MAG: hypothetical protein Q7S21_03810 [archaeon]|nr:hypothetical protein [archaeon]